MNKQTDSRRLRTTLTLLGGSIAVLSAGATHIQGATPSFVFGVAIGVLVGAALFVLARLAKIGPFKERAEVRVPSRQPRK